MLPPLADLTASARVVTLPMHTRFRGVDTREALLFEGPQGWAEFSPFIEYADAEAATWLAAAIDFAFQPQPAPLRDRIRVNATVPAVDAARVADVLARFAGCRTAKVKVAEPGQTLEDDVARVRAIREAMGPEGRIRVDANGMWNVDEAEHAVHALNEFDLEYVEQPCATVPELADLRKRVKYMGIPVAADESVRKSSDPLAVARARAADLLVIKAQPLGGVTHALQIVTAAGLPVVVSSALDTAVGLSQGAALAAALPNLDYDCGLGTASLFLDDVADLRPVDGSIPVGRVTPDAAALTRLAASGDRRDWWLERLERCHRVLASD
ncbi:MULTISPECIES: o-succinylbenzoate synthase [unclassified Microbacterium]|uniref:o-succinylbenzoate synthase n=1 Tax=unclassified Microbacterium TaxID=2609290 RepID=UPI000EA8BF52|nr:MULTISPECIES: o-succinylbenzoate synthase [unclassified Microbacterium]MBT2484922.1 o-succinylbenzoate synthase [Microbacterium sp. ISL-108]RKN67782.1 O-succinylbenzoate synthase [Microbacterium sp. CGR2]